MTSKSDLELIDRIMRILTTFSRETAEWGIADLAREVELPQSTVHRYLNSMVAWDLVVQNPLTRKYRLGIRLFQLGRLVADGMSIREWVRPHLSRLVDAAGETATVMIKRHEHAVCVDQVSSGRPLGLSAMVGDTLPLHRGSAGKVLLAFEDASVQESILASELRSFSPESSVDPARLRRELQEIRERRYAISIGEIDEGIASISAPVLDFDWLGPGAVSIVGPTSRLTEDRLAELVDIVVQTGVALSNRQVTQAM